MITHWQERIARGLAGTYPKPANASSAPKRRRMRLRGHIGRWHWFLEAGQ